MSTGNTEELFKRRSRPRSSRKRRRSFSDESADERPLGEIAGRKERTRKEPSPRKPQSDNSVRDEHSVSERSVSSFGVNSTKDTPERRRKPKKPFGPLSAPAHIRTSVRVDYQADVCKDYKETGYCGFGDSCKFLHDRSDYRAGWQLDKDWAEKEKERRESSLAGQFKGKRPEQVEVDDDDLPFACFICRKSFRNPVMTSCGHYFCEECAVARLEKDSTCAICHTQINGTLNAAQKLRAKLSQRSAL